MASFSSFDSDETIFNLIPRVLPTITKPPQHISKHDPTGKVTYSTLGKKAPNLGLSGPAAHHKNRPDNFLRKNSVLPASDGSGGAKGIRKVRPQQLAPLENKENAINGVSGKTHAAFNYNDINGRKPLVPRRDGGDNPVVFMKSSDKNFITANAVEAILKIPILKINKAAPDYLRKADYGKVPEYLDAVKKEITEENELIDDFVKAQMSSYADAPEYCEKMSESIRRDLIEKLKVKWDRINKDYQILCMHTIFEGNRKNTKERYEKQMSEIESDLGKLMVHGDVMIDFNS